MLLAGKKLLIVGVLDRRSIAFAIAKECQQAGAEIVLTSFDRVMTITRMTAKKLDPVPDVLELDVTRAGDFAEVASELESRWGHLDGIVHSIAAAPADSIGGNFLTAPWDSVAAAFRVGAFSLKDLAVSVLPLMRERGGSVVTMDFDNGVHAWPKYDWMGVTKAGLVSVVRYLARDLGPHQIRVNAIAAGPLATLAASAIPGFKDFEEVWHRKAPLGWDLNDRSPVAKTACALLSDYMPMTTGEVIHVDGGYHAMGADLPPVES
jgi:enoyl-[acyl-carrier protein] reductase I